MRTLLIADAYAPLRTSCAVQMRDLARGLVEQGHEVTVLVPGAAAGKRWTLESNDGVQVLRVRSFGTKDLGYLRRTLAEMSLPFMMWRGLRRSPLAATKWQAIVWYSPSIFLGPLVSALRRAAGCRSYLVLRDIFPEWAVDMGVLRRGAAYRFFKIVERFQYSVADVIGVQSPSNLKYLEAWATRSGRRLEVLHNWLGAAPVSAASLSVARTPLAGRTICVYAGNMGVAQGMDILLELATQMRNRHDVGFLFVGRGSEASRLREQARIRRLDNAMFFDEIEPCEIPALLAQCHVGILALDPRHRTHNVPGKFLAYMQAGLPVLARVNAGNDLTSLIESEYVGRVYVGDSADDLRVLAEELCADRAQRALMSVNARRLADSAFSVGSAVQQISTAVYGT